MGYTFEASGKRIRDLRRQKHMTQEELADALNISVSFLGKVETGKAGLSIEVFVQASTYFNTSLDYLILGKEITRDIMQNKLQIAMQALTEIKEII